jgi:hypothetical protein
MLPKKLKQATILDLFIQWEERGRERCLLSYKKCIHMTICKDSSKILSVILFSKYREMWLLLGACLVLTILWLPGYEYATVADTADYAVLGKNVWEHGMYALPGQVVKYLPLYPILSYPFTHAFGAHLGMKLASLLSGWGVLILSFLIARRQCGKVIAWGTVGALLIHHGFILMTTFGASDLLFTARKKVTVCSCGNRPRAGVSDTLQRISFYRVLFYLCLLETATGSTAPLFLDRKHCLRASSGLVASL